jgi:hypothetical protein
MAVDEKLLALAPLKRTRTGCIDDGATTINMCLFTFYDMASSVPSRDI